MVRKNLDRFSPGDQAPAQPRVPYAHRALQSRHGEYWSPEARERRGRVFLEEGFHISDDFRIVCDGIQPDGSSCGNVLGMAPLPEGHDGLCERCRRVGAPHPPRITTDPEKVDYGPHGDAWEQP